MFYFGDADGEQHDRVPSLLELRIKELNKRFSSSSGICWECHLYVAVLHGVCFVIIIITICFSGATGIQLGVSSGLEIPVRKRCMADQQVLPTRTSLRHEASTVTRNSHGAKPSTGEQQYRVSLRTKSPTKHSSSSGIT